MLFLLIFGIGFVGYGIYAMGLYLQGYGAVLKKRKGWWDFKFGLADFVKPKYGNWLNRQGVLLISILNLGIGLSFLITVYLLTNQK